MLKLDHQPMRDDPILQRIVPALAEVPGVAAIALGGSRARGTATETSDYDIGLYYSAARPLDTARLLQAARMLVDKPEAAEVTPVGGWGPWIVGGGWLSVDGRKVDLLYRSIEAVSDVIEKCRAGEIAMHYQPGHPHGFCSAIWMGEVALCQPLHDPEGRLAQLKAATSPYPAALTRRADPQIRMGNPVFDREWRACRGPRRADPCRGLRLSGAGLRGTVLFALNERYLINEKGALQEAACLPLTIPDIAKRAADIWRLIGSAELRAALAGLRGIERDVKQLTSPRGNRS